LQGVHSKDPYELETEFLGHLSQDDSPVLLLYVPGLHLSHASLTKTPPLLGPNVPAGHSLHFFCSVLSFYVPSLHFVQVLFPLVFCYVPLGHSSGPLDPNVEHLLPVGHFTQSLLSSDPVDGI